MSDRFSSKQVTVMVAAVCAAIVLAPTTVWAAATASSVKITYGSRTAHIDTSGRLAVGDGSGAMTVDGKVTTIGPTSSLNALQYVPPALSRVVLIGPTTASVAITRIGYTNPAANIGSTDTNFQLTIAKFNVGASGDCTGSDVVLAATISRLTTAPNTTGESAYAVPFVVKPTGTTKYCITAASSTYGSLPGTYYYPSVQLTGYVASGKYTGPGSSTNPAVLKGRAGTVR